METNSIDVFGGVRYQQRQLAFVSLDITLKITPRNMKFCCDGTLVVSNLESMVCRIKSSRGHHRSTN